MVCVISAPAEDAYPIKQWWEIDMSRDRVEGSWKQISGKLWEHWSQFRGDEAGVNAARHTQLAGRIQEQHGISKDEAERQLRDFRLRNRDWDLSRR